MIISDAGVMMVVTKAAMTMGHVDGAGGDENQRCDDGGDVGWSAMPMMVVTASDADLMKAAMMAIVSDALAMPMVVMMAMVAMACAPPILPERRRVIVIARVSVIAIRIAIATAIAIGGADRLCPFSSHAPPTSCQPASGERVFYDYTPSLRALAARPPARVELEVLRLPQALRASDPTRPN